MCIVILLYNSAEGIRKPLVYCSIHTEGGKFDWEISSSALKTRFGLCFLKAGKELLT